MTALAVKDESNEHKYFSVTPRLVWALSRDVYDYSFWTIIRDLAGEHGYCRIGAHRLGALTMMSPSKAHACRQYWMQVKMLNGELENTEGGRKVWKLTIPDVWLENIMWAQRYKTLTERLKFKAVFLQEVTDGAWRTAQDAAKIDLSGQFELFADRSPQERYRSPQERSDQNRSPQERYRSCGSVKEELKEEQSREEPKEDAVAFAPVILEKAGAKTDGASKAENPRGGKTAAGKAEIVPPRKPRERDELFETVCRVVGVSLSGLTDVRRGPINKAVAQLKKAGANAQGVADIPRWHAGKPEHRWMYRSGGHKFGEWELVKLWPEYVNDQENGEENSAGTSECNESSRVADQAAADLINQRRAAKSVLSPV